ncbi:MAG: M23 family metallopeptidase [Leptospirales bacterium]
MKNNKLYFPKPRSKSLIFTILALILSFVHFPLFSFDNSWDAITDTKRKGEKKEEVKEKVKDDEKVKEKEEEKEIEEEDADELRRKNRGQVASKDRQKGLYTLTRYYNKKTLEHSYYFTNEGYDYLSFTLTLSLEQMKADPSAKVHVIIPPLAKDIYLVTAKAIDPYKSHRFGAKAEMMAGNPNAVHNGTYAPPFEKGKEYYLSNAFMGNLSHKGKYAVDFNMPKGSMICAAREGVVVRMKNDGNKGGPSPKFNDDGNYVSILHSDGTYGNYAHFRQWGILVKVGDKIKEGQNIGYSGNTGYSTGPHLHFDVTKANGKGGFTTLPFQFRKLDGSLLDPEVGLTLTNN